MGAQLGAQIDDWIRDGGIVVTASERTARALQMAFHQRRRADGLTAWPAPSILAWTGFALSAWEAHALNERMLLNSAQEQMLWAEIIGREQHIATLLEAPRQRMASLAAEAHERLCWFAPIFLERKARVGWDLDPGAFSGWLSSFDNACRELSVVSRSRVPLEAVRGLLQDATPRAPLLAIGFDRFFPIHRTLFDAWGRWRELAVDEGAKAIHFYFAADEDAELNACAHWCREELAKRPTAQLLVISQQVSERRGEFERAFLRDAPPSCYEPLFEFSLGVPLSQVPLTRASRLILRWLHSPLAEHELDWLFSTGLLAGDPTDSFALPAYMRALRSRGLARPEWTLPAFVLQHAGKTQLPAGWLRRINRAYKLLSEQGDRPQTALTWAALVPELLAAAGFPGQRSLSSAEFQSSQRWAQTLETCGTLGFDGRRLTWNEFLTSLSRILDDTLFASESSDAPILIAGPAESAGLSANALWFLGADEDAWPPSGSAHPLIPLAVQRDSSMPHASPRHDLELAESMTKRVLRSAPVVHFSYPGRKGETETRPSRLIEKLARSPEPLPTHLLSARLEEPLTVWYADLSHVPFPRGKVSGGSSNLTAQSQCPFQAFALARLGAESWEPAEYGLSASQRGLLLHAVLHAVWGGPPYGLRSLDDLLNCANLHAFVAGHVRRVFDEKLPTGVADRMPLRYLQLETKRLTDVVKSWLSYEATRLPFTVAETESSRTIRLAELELGLRLDRIDRLNDDSLLVIDYKTGDVGPGSWQLPRPDDVQLPLYAGFGLTGRPGGLVFAKVRAGKFEFTGHLRDARNILFNDLAGNSSLVKKTLTDEQLLEWMKYIEQLARDFVSGRADASPREYPGTCQRCGLQALCRIHETLDEVELKKEMEVAEDV
jgi:ATP-dependent helicase/nuclease subunit B